MPSPCWPSDILTPTASRKVQTRCSILRSQPNPGPDNSPATGSLRPSPVARRVWSNDSFALSFTPLSGRTFRC